MTFFILKVDQKVPFFNKASNQHILLNRIQDGIDGILIIVDLVFFEIDFVGTNDDHWAILLISAVGINVSIFQYLSALLGNSSDELILMPLVVQLHLVIGLMDHEITEIAESKQQLIGVGDVGCFLLEIVFEFMYLIALEGFVMIVIEDPPNMFAIDLLIDVVFWML